MPNNIPLLPHCSTFRRYAVGLLLSSPIPFSHFKISDEPPPQILLPSGAERYKIHSSEMLLTSQIFFLYLGSSPVPNPLYGVAYVLTNKETPCSSRPIRISGLLKHVTSSTAFNDSIKRRSAFSVAVFNSTTSTPRSNASLGATPLLRVINIACTTSPEIVSKARGPRRASRFQLCSVNSFSRNFL